MSVLGVCVSEECVCNGGVSEDSACTGVCVCVSEECVCPACESTYSRRVSGYLALKVSPRAPVSAGGSCIGPGAPVWGGFRECWGGVLYWPEGSCISLGAPLPIPLLFIPLGR